MSESISYAQTFGGLGLFLLGMITMTDALKALAGDSIRSALMRFTRSPVSGAMTGATSTALLQSSSATTVAAVGFVGAGLMSFPSALGIIFGANLGTTITGWIVTLFGFKLKLSAVMLPCIFVGAILRLMFSGRTSAIGLAIAGFGLVFVGIDNMQAGMSSMRGMLDGLELTGDSYFDRIKLLGLGAIFTIITQSSSAGIAAVLTALYADALTLGQGLSLVIGMDIGTTVTAVMATIGGSVGSKRTGYSHFIYNILTGICAFIMLTPYLMFWERLSPEQLETNKQVVLVAFHSGFNLFGVLLILPFTNQFARLIERLIPSPDASYTERLDKALLNEPTSAIEAVAATVNEEFSALLSHIQTLLTEDHSASGINLDHLQEALDETHSYVDQINLQSPHSHHTALVSIFHVLDHLQRLHERCDEEESRAYRASVSLDLKEQYRCLLNTVHQLLKLTQQHQWQQARALCVITNKKIHSSNEPTRNIIMNHIAEGKLDVPDATHSLEAIRWMNRVSYHLAQITTHLEQIFELDQAIQPQLLEA